jgi:hypothetical protein
VADRIGTARRKPWALLAYTVADDKGGGSSLDVAAREELKAICDAADFGRLSVAAQVDFKRTSGVFRGSLTTPPPKGRDFEPVTADRHPLWRKILGGVKQSVLKVEAEASDLNAARASVLQQFLRFGERECPADRYLIYFYGHAYGPMGLFYDAASNQRDPNTLRLNNLAGSIEKVEGRAAVVLFRDCFMNTLETAYQLHDVAEFMIATQAEAPIAGVWPWKAFLEALDPDAAPVDAALTVAIRLGEFLDHPPNRGPFGDVPFSLIDLDAVSSIAGPLKALTSALERARGDSRRASACARALERARIGFPDDQSQPGDPALIDVVTMCEGLEALGDDPAAAPAAALGDLVRRRVVRWHHSQQGRFKGISLYYKPVKPEDIERSYIQAGSDEDAARDAAYYEELALSEATGWHRVALDPLAAPAS